MFSIFRWRRRCHRFYCIKHATEERIKYTGTINLPKTDFPTRLSDSKRAEIEIKFIETVTTSCYRYQKKHNNDPVFVLHDGPPYANGDLHMGHAVNKILKDITLRHRVIRGQRVNFIPGWDCHGLPIELKAMSTVYEKNINTNNKDPLNIRKISRKYAEETIDNHKAEFHSWGILCDWNDQDGLYFTFSAKFIRSQLALFLNFYEKGLIYRDLKPVYWSPSSRTALAEAELEYEPNFVSPSLYARFRLTSMPPSLAKQIIGDCYALIWTTTPWTLPSNQAVCFNSNLKYVLVRLKNSILMNDSYIIAQNLLKDFEKNTNIQCDILHIISGSELHNCTYQHPINVDETSMLFLDGVHVLNTKGTGLVHTAPAHGPDDFLICLANNIPIRSLVDDEGKYNNNSPSFLQGKSVLDEGNNLVLEHLHQNIIHISSLKHSYPIDWRTKKPVIIKASQQWFINTGVLKDNAVQEIDKIAIYPLVCTDSNKNLLQSNILKRPYWCISRQRAWGVPIPVFYDKNSGKVITNKTIVQHISNLVEQKQNIDFWWSHTIDELLPQQLLENLNLKTTNLVKGMDIFDIWFDSGSTWLQILKDQEKADLYMEGYDQFSGWFQSSLLTSLASRNCSPYKAIFVHGFTVDENGNKMSKSLGNVISPKSIINKYGTNVLRWWVAAHGTQHMAITVCHNLLQQSENSLIKLRSVLRYLNAVIGIKSKYNENMLLPLNGTILPSSFLNRYLLSKLIDFENEIFNLYDCYEYNRVVAKLQYFVSNIISGTYVHLIKDRLYCGNKMEILAIRDVLQKCYFVLCKVLWPIIPILVEESWNYYDNTSQFYQQNMMMNTLWKDTYVENVIETALQVKRLINQQISCKNTWLLKVKVSCRDMDFLHLLQEIHPELNCYISDTELCEILQVNSVFLNMSNSHNNDSAYNVQIEKKLDILCPRCKRFCLRTENNDVICDRCLKVLNANNTETITNAIKK